MRSQPEYCIQILFSRLDKHDNVNYWVSHANYGIPVHVCSNMYKCCTPYIQCTKARCTCTCTLFYSYHETDSILINCIQIICTVHVHYFISYHETDYIPINCIQIICTCTCPYTCTLYVQFIWCIQCVRVYE